MDATLDLAHAMTTPRQWQALQRAARLGYDFDRWVWQGLPIEELEGELERMEAHMAERRYMALAEARRLGYDFAQWDPFGLPIDELEGELERGNEYARRDAQQMEQSCPAPTMRAREAKRPDILSQLTTTETVRLPNGTVMTNVFMKKRFADGREEVLESSHTTQEQSGTQRVEEAETKQQQQQQQQQQPARKGWLW